MSIKVTCPGCGKTVKAPEKYAGKVAKCPACGSKMKVPIPEAVAVTEAPTGPRPREAAAPLPPASEQDLIATRPAVFRTRPVSTVFWGAVILVGSLTGFAGAGNVRLAGFGLAAFAAMLISLWFLDSFTTQLRITNKRSILRRGILAKRTREVRHSDVRLLQVDQSFFQRLLKVGRVSLASAGHGEVEIMVDGLKDPQHIKETIDGYRT